MATIPKKKTYSSEDLTFARRNGFKRKKPTWVKDGKSPKLTEANVISHNKKYNTWVDDMKKAASDYRSKQAKRKKQGIPESQRLRNALKG